MTRLAEQAPIHPSAETLISLEKLPRLTCSSPMASETWAVFPKKSKSLPTDVSAPVPPNVRVAPQPAQVPVQPAATQTTKRSGYEKYSDPDYIPDLQDWDFAG
jgi:hypothetical protein